MNKLLLVFLAACAGALVFGSLRRDAAQTRAATALKSQEWQSGTNQLAATQKLIAGLRGEVLDERQRLRVATRHRGISPELLLLLEGDSSKGHSAAWAELRQQLGIGWDSSPDYVLVSKHVLKQLDYPQLLSGLRASDTASALLAFSPAEQTGFRAALDHARQGQWLRIERNEPGGDIVAQYTVPPPEPGFEQGLSNTFSAEIVGAVGSERADLLLPRAWREFKSGLAPSEAETMTVRRAIVDGEQDLICEMKRGNKVSTSPVRYARYPSMWFLTMFPGGWKTLAEREGFELPARFQK